MRRYDYGTDGENYWLVMKQYKTSLKDWRLRQTAPLAQMLPLYLQIYAQVLDAMAHLDENSTSGAFGYFSVGLLFVFFSLSS